MFVVRRAFRGPRGILSAGSVIEPADIKDFKYRLREKHLVEVDEHNFERYKTYFKDRHGVDLQALPVDNTDALKAAEEAAKAEAEAKAAEEAAKAEAEAKAAEEAAKAEAEAKAAEEASKAEAEAKAAEEAAKAKANVKPVAAATAKAVNTTTN